MKRYFITLCCLIASLIFQGCDKEIPFEEIQNTVFYEITSQSPNTILHIDATGLEEPIYIRSNFSNRCRTKNHFAILKVSCSDPYELITAKLYVNGKLVRACRANKSIRFSYRLKGD